MFSGACKFLSVSAERAGNETDRAVTESGAERLRAVENFKAGSTAGRFSAGDREVTPLKTAGFGPARV